MNDNIEKLRQHLHAISALCSAPHWTPERKQKIHDHAFDAEKQLQQVEDKMHDMLVATARERA